MGDHKGALEDLGPRGALHQNRASPVLQDSQVGLERGFSWVPSGALTKTPSLQPVCRPSFRPRLDGV